MSSRRVYRARKLQTRAGFPVGLGSTLTMHLSVNDPTAKPIITKE